MMVFCSDVIIYDLPSKPLGFLNDRVLELFRCSEIWRIDLSASCKKENGLNLAGVDALKGVEVMTQHFDVYVSMIYLQLSRNQTASNV
jgi:hypothetical protein